MLPFGLTKARGRSRVRGRSLGGIGERPRLMFDVDDGEDERRPRAVEAQSDGDEFESFMADIKQKAEVARPAAVSTQENLTTSTELAEDARYPVRSFSGKVDENSPRANCLEQPQNIDNSVDEAVDGSNEPILSDRRGSFSLPIDPVDHTTVDYIDVRKDLWRQTPQLSALTDSEIASRRELNRLTVTGTDQEVGAIPPPILTFGEAGTSIGPKLLHATRLVGYSSPTEIQSQAIPVALRGYDLIAIAKTGSGKTAAFVIPLLASILDQPFVGQAQGPIGLILAPTRELALQIGSEARKFASHVQVKVDVIVGGQPKFEQFKGLRDGGAECVVATPGRMIDMLKMKACGLSRVSFLVLDEADRMFDLGFEGQVRSILGQIRPDRQTLFFSATFKARVEKLANDACGISPVRIVVGEVGQVNDDIEQNFHAFPSGNSKTAWLQAWLRANPNDSVVVFATTKASCAQLANALRAGGQPTASIHGETQQDDREGMMRMFRRKEVNVLVATDIAARGLDIKGVSTVINFEVPTTLDWYTHRIGRTGRAGLKGVAHTLFVSGNRRDSQFAEALADKLGEDDCPAGLRHFMSAKREVKRPRR